jgi:hypothetical protein
VDATNDRLNQPGWTGVLDRPAFVVVHRDHHDFPGVLFEWRRRRYPDGFIKRSARVIFLDGDKILRQSWFLETFVEPASFIEPKRMIRPRSTQTPPVSRGSAESRPRGGRLSKQPATLTTPSRTAGLRRLS